MTPAPLQERSLLVKTLPGRPAPYALEDLRSGWRREFPSPQELLAALATAIAGGSTTNLGDRE